MSASHFAVFGHPVAYSLSPRIHARFAEQTNIHLYYSAIDAPLESFAAQLTQFHDANGSGANVTLPLKVTAAALCFELSASARRIGAVNTLARRDHGWRGDNTDGAGLIRDLGERHAFDIRGTRALLLGAGGAARATAFALRDAGLTELVIVNRNAQRAADLAAAIGDPARVHSIRWSELAVGGTFDLIVNATSAGHQHVALELPSSLVAATSVCYDLSYAAAASGFLAWARIAGAARALDGLGMLVEQAAESFLIWHGLRPQTAAVFAELRAEFPLPTSS